MAADLAALDDERDPSRGVHGRVDLRHAAGLRNGDPDYNQWRLEGRAYLPVFAKRRVIAVRGVYAGVDPSGGATASLPFYRLPRSEGASRFAGYASERFRDRQLMLARIEYRWAILYRMSALALYELGEVAPDAGSFSLHGAHQAYGGGLRLGLSDEATLRLEVAKSVEGLHAVFALGGDF
jgi:outer membrane protein assembly factor BamA